MPTVIDISGVIESRWNAIKFTPERGSIKPYELRQANGGSRDGRGYGPGIPSDQLANIF